MNLTQKAWLWVGLVGMAGMLAVPPWQFAGEQARPKTIPGGYAPLWEPPPLPTVRVDRGDFSPEGFLDFLQRWLKANPGKFEQEAMIQAYWRENWYRFEPDTRRKVASRRGGQPAQAFLEGVSHSRGCVPHRSGANSSHGHRQGECHELR